LRKLDPSSPGAEPHVLQRSASSMVGNTPPAEKPLASIAGKRIVDSWRKIIHNKTAHNGARQSYAAANRPFDMDNKIDGFSDLRFSRGDGGLSPSEQPVPRNNSIRVQVAHGLSLLSRQCGCSGAVFGLESGVRFEPRCTKHCTQRLQIHLFRGSYSAPREVYRQTFLTRALALRRPPKNLRRPAFLQKTKRRTPRRA
jgi:hypothetical protein